MKTHTNNPRFRGSVTAFIALLGLSMITLPAAGGAQEGSKPQAVILKTRTITATVEAVDYQTRMATLKRSDGSIVTFRVSDNFHNLDKVKVGDTVKAVYFDSTAITVRKPTGSEGEPTTKTVEILRPGHKPEGMIAKTTTTVVTVTAIDYKKRTATLQGPDGSSFDVKVGPEVKRFNEVKKNDQIVVQVTEAIAASIQK